MINKTFYATAALALALAAASPVLGAKLRLPPARAPEGSIYSPAAIAGELAKRGYRLEKMKRKGTAYSVTATGPSGNRVQMLVDGRSGDIVGLTVVQAAANLIGAVAAALKSDKNTRYYDDTRPFGVIVPDRYQVNWTQITNWNAPRGAPRYAKAPKSGRGYRYAVPHRTIRPAVGGGTRSTYSPKQMSRPVYDVYDSSGSQLETVETREDSMTLTQVTTEETRFSSQEDTFESSYESSYFGSEVSDGSLAAGDYDAEDGDRIFADDPGDAYDAGIETAGFSDYSETIDDSGEEEFIDDEPGPSGPDDDEPDDVEPDDDEPDDIEPEDDEPDDVEPEDDEPEEEEEEEEPEEEEEEEYEDDGGDDDDGGDEDDPDRR